MSTIIWLGFVPKPKKAKKSLAKRLGFVGKTPWDFIQLLLIPLVLASVGYLFTAQQNQTSTQIAKDTQEEATLKAYLDDMTTLLLDKKLGSPAPADKVASADAAVVARAKTLTALRRLTDAQRKARALQFLYEAGLIGFVTSNSPSTRFEPIINLDSADLRKANLVNFAMPGANLSGVDLTGADLTGTDLTDANLSSAKLSVTDLLGVKFRRANLSGAYLKAAHLPGAHLTDADLSGASLSEAYLTDAWFEGADLSGANLYNAYLFGANLSEARNLDQTILTDARYNTKAIWVNYSYLSAETQPTQWPQGFDPKAAGAIEDNTNC